MAFNPFDAFRKNSKPMMAALTIFVMIVFVLSTGGGGSDFFDWMARQVGGTDTRGAVLGTARSKADAFAIVEILVVGVDLESGFRSIAPNVHFMLVKIDERDA